MLKFLFVIMLSILNLEAKIIDIGGNKINLTDPNGFIGVKGKSAEFDKALNYFVTPTNKQFEVFIRKDFDFVNKQLLSYDFDSYILIQTPKGFINKDFTLKYFKENMIFMKNNFLKRLETLEPEIKKSFEKISKEMSSEYDVKIDLKLNYIIPMEIFIDEDKVFSSLSLMNINNELFLGSANILLLNKKIVFVYIYKTYKSNKDIEYTKNLSSEYVNSLLLNNK